MTVMFIGLKILQDFEGEFCEVITSIKKERQLRCEIKDFAENISGEYLGRIAC